MLAPLLWTWATSPDFGIRRPYPAEYGRRTQSRAHPAEDRRPTDVYLAVGYEDYAHFSRAFKRQYGASPRNYVRRNRVR